MPESTAHLNKNAYIEAVRTNSDLLAQAGRLGLREMVPSCPGWCVATLVAHLGEVQRFWALQVKTRAQEEQPLPQSAFESCSGLPAWLEGVDAGKPDMNAIPYTLLQWFQESTDELVAVFGETSPEERIWHWSGDDRGITHMRNQAIEATVHRWDAQNAHNATTAIDPDIAADGIQQHFDVQIGAARKWGDGPEQGEGETYHLHRTDGQGEWLVRFDGDDHEVLLEHGKGDIALRGSAEDLFLWLWGRVPADGLEIHGDRSLLKRYRRLVPSSS